MGKSIANTVYDAALDKLATGNRVHLCYLEPTSFAEVLSQSLGAVTVDTTDFTKADGDTSGRKTTIAAQTGFSITATSTVDHFAVIDSTQLLGVTTHPAAAVTSGDSRNSAAFDLELRDPV